MMGDFATTSSPAPQPLASSVAQPPPPVAAPSAPPIALVPEERSPVATLGREASQLPPDAASRAAQTGAPTDPRKKLLSPEEKAAIIAELEALAQQQSAR